MCSGEDDRLRRSSACEEDSATRALMVVVPYMVLGGKFEKYNHDKECQCISFNGQSKSRLSFVVFQIKILNIVNSEATTDSGCRFCRNESKRNSAVTVKKKIFLT